MQILEVANHSIRHAFAHTVVVFRGGPFRAPRAHSRDVGLEALDLGSVRFRRQFHERVQGHFHPRRLFLWYLHKVRKNTADDGLVTIKLSLSDTIVARGAVMKRDTNRTNQENILEVVEIRT